MHTKQEAALYRIADSGHISHRCCKNTPALLLHPPADSVSTLEHFAPAFLKEIPTFLFLPTEKSHYLLYDGMFPGFLFHSSVLHQQHAMHHTGRSAGFLPLPSDVPVPDNTLPPGYHPCIDFSQTSALPLPVTYGLRLQSRSGNPPVKACILLLCDTHLPVSSCDCRFE